MPIVGAFGCGQGSTVHSDRSAATQLQTPQAAMCVRTAFYHSQHLIFLPFVLHSASVALVQTGYMCILYNHFPCEKKNILCVCENE